MEKRNASVKWYYLIVLYLVIFEANALNAQDNTEQINASIKLPPDKENLDVF